MKLTPWERIKKDFIRKTKLKYKNPLKTPQMKGNRDQSLCTLKPNKKSQYYKPQYPTTKQIERSKYCCFYAGKPFGDIYTALKLNDKFHGFCLLKNIDKVIKEYEAKGIMLKPMLRATARARART